MQACSVFFKLLLAINQNRDALLGSFLQNLVGMF